MKTKYKSIACPKCKEKRGSEYTYANVETSSYETDIKKNRGCISRQLMSTHVVKCKCKDCGNEYNISYNKMIRIVDENTPSNQIGDAIELVEYQSQITRDFSLIAVKTSPYDDHRNKDDNEFTYLIVLEDDTVPIKITKETAMEIYRECEELYNRDYEEIENTPVEPSYAKQLSFDSYMGRYR